MRKCIIGFLLIWCMCIPVQAIVENAGDYLIIKDVSTFSEYTTSFILPEAPRQYLGCSYNLSGSLRYCNGTVSKYSQSGSSVIADVTAFGHSTIYGSTGNSYEYNAAAQNNAITRLSDIQDPSMVFNSQEQVFSDGTSCHYTIPLNNILGKNSTHVICDNVRFSFTNPSTLSDKNLSIQYSFSGSSYESAGGKSYIRLCNASGTITWSKRPGNNRYCSVGSIESLSFPTANITNSKPM